MLIRVIAGIIVGRVNRTWQMVWTTIDGVEFQGFITRIGHIVPNTCWNKDSLISPNFYFKVKIIFTWSHLAKALA